MDIIGLLGESRQETYFSFLSDETRTKNSSNADTQRISKQNLRGWVLGKISKKLLSDKVDVTKPEAVQYLPQHHFEELTNEIEIEAFRGEIEDVVFSHVDETDRMGKIRFQELEEFKTQQTKNETSSDEIATS